MARITLPKLGSVEDVPTWAAIAVVMILTVGALFGLAIWQGVFDSPNNDPADVRTTTTASFVPIDSYGDDPYLDSLWDDCEFGDFDACWELYWDSPVGSDYEAFAEEMIG